MTEKYKIEELGDMFRVLKDGEPLTTKFENTDRMDVINLVEELNELSRENDGLSRENGELKLFIKKISDHNGEIWLSNGYGYRLKRIFRGEWWK